MKKSGLLLFVLLVGSISYVLAQQSIDGPAVVPPTPAGLVATEHLPLPKELSQYWLVPGKVNDERFASLSS